MSDGLYQKHRPKTLKEIMGQDEAVSILTTFLSNGGVPHALLFSGPSGVGKTTLARILKTELECSDADFSEVNCADEGSIAMVRDIRSRMGLAPLHGKCRIWYLDEFQSLSRAGFAQQALLKMLEDTPKHVYFFLATTDPQKIIPTIRGRCTPITLSAFQPKVLRDLLDTVAKREKFKLADAVRVHISEAAEGSARKALVLLESVMGLENEEDQINAVENSDSRKQSIDIARALIREAKWEDVKGLIKAVEEEPETVRRVILGYASSVLLGAGGKVVSKAYEVLCAFESHWYDCGKAGLVRACYEVCRGK